MVNDAGQIARAKALEAKKTPQPAQTPAAVPSAVPVQPAVAPQ
jgi:hypothetical protein